MRSTNNSNAFTETESKAKIRKQMLRDPDGVLGFGEDMSNMDRPAFQRELNKDEIDKILAENPEIEEEFNNERQRWLEFGEEDPNNINPLSDYNTLLVSKMQKGYDKKADGMIQNFRNPSFGQQLAKIEEERQQELDDLEMDKYEMQGKAVAFQNAEGIKVRKKIKRKKKGKKKKGKMFILDTPYGKAKYYKRQPSPEAVEENNNVLFQNRSNVNSKTKEKARKLKKAKKEQSFDNKSGSSIVEGDEVMFDTGLGPNQVNESDDEMDEADMVMYNKDDMTNFSKSLGLNKMQSRLSLINWRKSQDKLSTGGYGDEMAEDDEAEFATGNNFSPEPKSKLIQRKKKKKKRRTKSISHSLTNFGKIGKYSARSAISSRNSEDNYTSEEDNPNDRSGLLDVSRKKKKGKIKKKKNKWLSKKDEGLGRKSFRNTSNLSLVLPKYKSRMKRSKVIRKKKSNLNPIFTSDSPYEEYLPARFKDVNKEDLENSRYKENRNIREPRQLELPSEYGAVSPIFTSSSKPPLNKSAQKSLNFYGSNKKSKKRAKEIDRSDDSFQPKSGTLSNNFNKIIHSKGKHGDNYNNSSSDGAVEVVNHRHMFKRSNKVESPLEDKPQRPPRELLFAMNKDFHNNIDKIHSVDSRNGSKDGRSREGSRGRTYTTKNAVISQVKFQ